jgi:hypothetical protein
MSINARSAVGTLPGIRRIIISPICGLWRRRNLPHSVLRRSRQLRLITVRIAEPANLDCLRRRIVVVGVRGEAGDGGATAATLSRRTIMPQRNTERFALAISLASRGRRFGLGNVVVWFRHGVSPRDAMIRATDQLHQGQRTQSPGKEGRRHDCTHDPRNTERFALAISFSLKKTVLQENGLLGLSVVE